MDEQGDGQADMDTYTYNSIGLHEQDDVQIRLHQKLDQIRHYTIHYTYPFFIFYFQVTKSGFTLDGAIQTDVDNPGHPLIKTVGCIADDEESYEVFADLSDPIIKDLACTGNSEIR